MSVYYVVGRKLLEDTEARKEVLALQDYPTNGSIRILIREGDQWRLEGVVVLEDLGKK